MKYNPDIHHRRSIRLKGYDYSQTGAYFVTICTQHRKCLFGEIANGQMAMNNAGRMVQTVWNEIPENYHGIETDEFVVMPNHIHGIVVIVGAAPRGRPDVPRGRHGTMQQRDVGQSMNTGQSRNDGQPRGVTPTGTDGYWQTMNGGRSRDTGQPQGVAPTGMDGYWRTMNARQPMNTGQPRNDGQPRGVAPTLSLPDVVHRFKTMTTKRYTDGVKQHGWPPYPGKLWQRNYYEHIIRNENELNRIRQYIIENPMKWDSDRENPHGSILETTAGNCKGRS